MPPRRTPPPDAAPADPALADPALADPALADPAVDKACAICGRRITWRASFARAWPEVRRCGEACRRRRLGDVDRALEDALRRLISTRSGSCCPSEAARAVDPEGWAGRMEAAREAARRLVARGEAEITQGGRGVDPSTARGPIRVRRAQRPPLPGWGPSAGRGADG
jgi:hypothetical protein